MKRIIAVILTVVMLFALSASAFASGSGSYTLYMDRNGKVLKDASGTKVYGRTQEKVFQKFYKLMKSVPVNWDKFDYSQYDVTIDAEGVITFVKQVMGANDGSSVSSDNPEVVIFETPGSFHAVSTGDATLTQYDHIGNVLGSSKASVTALSNGSCLLTNICGKCGKDQGQGFHLMVCGHYSCEVGEVGHGAAPCGVPGHMNCDGSDHGTCPNCLKPLCSGAHGVGVCQHVHNWQQAGAGFLNGKWVVRYYCPGCNTYTCSTDELPPFPFFPSPLPPKPTEPVVDDD